jgi:hypothetical protein
MLGVTFFGLLMTPVFYVMVRTLGTRRQRAAQPVVAAPLAIVPFESRG